jgi:thiamine biosynthesis lipoprotein
MDSTPRATRREFLKGQAALNALTQFDVGAGGDLPTPSDDRYLLRLSRRAMACTFEVFLNAGQYSQGSGTALAALDLVDQLEEQLSVYRETSEISRLNEMAFFTDVAVEARLFALLDLAARLHDETGGAYDITAGRLSRVWGFTRRQGKIPAADELEMARECAGNQYVQLDRAAQSVRFARPGLEINLGSIGKGYALDRAAELLEQQGVHDFLLHGGSSSVLARGSHAADGEGAGWCVGVRNPLRPQLRLGQLRLGQSVEGNRALATSGSGTQFFLHEGQRYGHILDPRSGWPASGVLSVSTLAPTAAEADALSTAFYVLGPEAAAAYCQTHPEIGFIMICPGERAGALTTHQSGLEEGQWTVLEEPSPA